MMGIKAPHIKTIGKRRKFEKAMASHTFVAQTEIARPMAEKTRADRIIPSKRRKGEYILIFTKIIASINTTAEVNIPKLRPAMVFPKTIVVKLTGEVRSLSKVPSIFSKTIATASTEVVLKSRVMPINPGIKNFISPEPLIPLAKARNKKVGNTMLQVKVGGVK